jgi:hypothetical protein
MPAPLVVTVRAVDNLTPEADGRHWTAAEYAARDAQLVALGIMPFHQSPARQKK